MLLGGSSADYHRHTITPSPLGQHLVTYCMAFRLDEGLIFLSDTRTNAGVDNVGTYRKLHVLRAGDDRLFVLAVRRLACNHTRGARPHQRRSGNARATTRAWPPSSTSTRPRSTSGGSAARSSQRHLAGARLVGARRRSSSAARSPASAPDIFLVYPEGNYIRVSDERPFLQIGESKYGKFMLELAVHAQVRLEGAIKIALSSMVSTAHANLSVGPPYDLGVYLNGSLELIEPASRPTRRTSLRSTQVWMTHFLDAIAQLPPLPIP